MATRALLLAVALCAVQHSQALSFSFDVTGTMMNFTKIMNSMQNSQAEFEAYLDNIGNEIKQNMADITSSFQSTIDDINADIQKRVQEVEGRNIAASTCSENATVNLTDINDNLMNSLANCFTKYDDYLDFYVANMKNDSYTAQQVLKNAQSDYSKCNILNMLCFNKITISTASSMDKIRKDMDFQLTNAFTALLNLEASINKCNWEANAQSVLDAYHVFEDFNVCIKALEAESADSS